MSPFIVKDGDKVDTYELAVIGGGATGAGAFWDASARGIKTVLLEKEYPAYGATGRCHGLLHSGARYLVQDLHTALECAAENKIVAKIAAGAVENTGGYFLQLNDDAGYRDKWLAAAAANDFPYREVSLSEFQASEPLITIKPQRVYWVDDKTVDPFKLAVALIQGGLQHGGHYKGKHEVTGIARQRNSYLLSCLDHSTGTVRVLQARAILNAAGAWAGKIVRYVGLDIPIAYSRGTLYVFNTVLNKKVLNILRFPNDGDILVPGKSVSIYGTTAVQAGSPDEQLASAGEMVYLNDKMAEFGLNPAEHRILRMYAGIRPLLGTGSEDGRELKRSFRVINHEQHGYPGFVSVVGGKLTTFRLMAESALDLIARHLGVNTPCKTREQVLPALFAAEDGASLICECENKRMPSPGADLWDQPGWAETVFKALRYGMGTCQGSFCFYRYFSQSSLRDLQKSQKVLRDVLCERRQGMYPWSGENLGGLEIQRCLYNLNFSLKEGI